MDEDVFVDLGEPVQPLNMSPVVVVQQHTPPVDNIVVIDLESSPVVRRSSVKKRKRQSVFSPSQKDPPTPKERRKFLDEDDDDGATCSICLEQWEMCGEHRLTSLKCGHLFGQSCIKRWLQECTSGTKSCPSCKTKATLRDFRFLYAKRLCALDNTENVELRSRLESTQSSLVKTQAEKNLIDFELKHEISKVKKLQEENEYLRMRLASGQSGQATIVDEKIQNSIQLRRIKLFLDKTIEISRESGCRCMSYSRWENMLYVSQKSTQNLFAGYGVRYVDVATLKPTRYLPVSAKQIRDLDVTNLSENDTNYLLTATMEKQGRLFDLRTSTLHQSFVVDEGQSMIWSCCYDVNEANFLYFGSGQGQVYLYDKRSPMRFINEFKIHNEHSPVINVASVGVNRNTLPYGGLLVCKLKEIVFYEFTDQFSTSSRTITVNIEGPFNAMSYDQATKLVLITTRCSKKYPICRYIIAEFVRAGDSVNLVVRQTVQGSDMMPVMSKPAQYFLGDTEQVLLTAYLQNTKLLSTWVVGSKARIQALPVSETVLDLQPLNLGGSSYLAALCDTKCRIFKVHDSV